MGARFVRISLQVGGSIGERVATPPPPSPVLLFGLIVIRISNSTRSSGVSLLIILSIF